MTAASYFRAMSADMREPRTRPVPPRCMWRGGCSKPGEISLNGILLLCSEHCNRAVQETTMGEGP